LICGSNGQKISFSVQLQTVKRIFKFKFSLNLCGSNYGICQKCEFERKFEIHHSLFIIIRFHQLYRKNDLHFMFSKTSLFKSSLKFAVCRFCITALCSESTDEKSLKFRETRNSCQMSRKDNKTMCSVFRSSFLISFVNRM